MRTYKLIKDFKNYYTRKMERITFYYDVYDGFPSLKEAERGVKNLHQEPTNFLYITFLGQIYAVSMETKKQQLVIGSEKIFLHNNNQPTLLDRSEQLTLPFVIRQPRISGEPKKGLTRDLKRLEGGHINFIGDKSLLNDSFVGQAQHLLAMSFFATKIPVYQLNCVDHYFPNPPSHQDLWAQGIRALNPFTNEKTYANCALYTLDIYLKEKRA